jgi:hypothetical protein
VLTPTPFDFATKQRLELDVRFADREARLTVGSQEVRVATVPVRAAGARVLVGAPWVRLTQPMTIRIDDFCARAD